MARAILGNKGNFGQLGGFARAGFTADDDDLVRLHGGHDFFAARGYRQGFGEVDFERCRHGRPLSMAASLAISAMVDRRR